ncbi:heterogeneous nuclear rnp K-like protein 2 [Monosporozyma unispora]|nr:RNA binding protein, heterogenous nuclear RNP-K like protein [Kazachstania unispora]
MTTFINNDSATNDSSIALQSAINHRVLLSLPEAAKIIGTKGSTIDKIRNDNNVKIGISEKIPGCSDRILSCAGTIINVANALADVMSLINEDTELISKKYHFHFLNHILPPPSTMEISGNDQSNLNKIGTLRLIILNSHLSSIIGKSGQTIKGLIDKHGVKIVASRDFLPDSSERVLEIQGFSGSVANILIDISEILIQDVDITFSSERRYFPHLKNPIDTNSNSPHRNINNNTSNSNNNERNQNHTSNNNNNNSTNNRTPNLENTNSIENSQLTVLIPETYVGAVVGRQGNRIANLRKFTKTRILIEKNDPNGLEHEQKFNDQGEPCRVFTIIGNSMKQIKLAESMLLRNLETEVERRMAKENSENLRITTIAVNRDATKNDVSMDLSSNDDEEMTSDHGSSNLEN